MDQEVKQKIALFRYSLIAPLIAETFSQGSAKDYLEEICAKKHTTPKGEKKEYSPETLKFWLHLYRKQGIDGLYPKSRSDKGDSRKLSDETAEYIISIKSQFPKSTAKSIYNRLIAQGLINYSEISLSTVQRYLSKNKLKIGTNDIKDRRAFEFEFPNECWQSDISVGPYLTIGDRKYKTYIIAILDDSSRMIIHCEAFYQENLSALLTVFKKAVAKRGIPKKLFVDNGKVYKSNQLELICASLGTILCYAKPYSPESKGKIERWFKTLQEQWLNVIDWKKFSSLEHFNEQLSQYIEKIYNQNVHSSIKEKPMDKFLRHIDRIKFISSKEELDNLFLYRVTRKVKNDSTISLQNQLFEVPLKYMKEYIQVRYDPTALDLAYIFSEDNKLIDTIFPVIKIDNTTIRRNETVNKVDFSPFSKDENTRGALNV